MAFLKERGLPHPPWLVDGEDDVDAAARSVMVEEEEASFACGVHLVLAAGAAPCGVCMQRSTSVI